MRDQRNLITLFPSQQNEEVIREFAKKRYATLSGSGNFSSKVFILADLLRECTDLKKILWVVNDQVEQENIARALLTWTNLSVKAFRVEENGAADPKVERQNKIGIIEEISQIKGRAKTVVVITYPDLLRKYPSYEEIKKNSLGLIQGEEISPVDLFEKLIRMGYEVALDPFIKKGEYYRQGEVLDIYPVNHNRPIRIELGFEEVGKIFEFAQETKEAGRELKKVEIYPLGAVNNASSFFSFFEGGSLFIEDELEIIEEYYQAYEEELKNKNPETAQIVFASFLEESPYHHHLHFLSVLKYQNALDLVADLREKLRTAWQVFLFTKNQEEIEGVFKEKKVEYLAGLAEAKKLDFQKGNIVLLNLPKEEIFPLAFQNPKLKIILLTDREIMGLREKEKKILAHQKVYLDFLTSLKPNDYVVHAEHGVGRFLGLEKRTVDEITREYLKLGYAENDKLFVPIDQADKVSKFIGTGDHEPHLTRLGSAEWATITNKVRKETEKIARELLELYAKREKGRGFIFRPDNNLQQRFEETFPYEETPGQIRAIWDVKKDMEKLRPMDRLICGDVGFGKTEVAMRAAFKAVQGKKQVAFISPITILTDQHYQSFVKRMKDFHIRVEMLSRFKSPKEQKDILRRLARGEVDIIIATHRLLQKDVGFKNLGLVIIDEEQRFGVRQKERLKQIRTEVDVLTLTATPIPRTLNLSLHGLRDITTITTPPPGRLPIITEVRRFSFGLIREVILRELQREGQIYFLHNRVQTIDDMANKLRSLIPEAKIIVTHGKLSSYELERRILDFKNRKYDILVSSTIIENGIDLSNVNTLIVNQAEKFGLAQLYQLRGRVGRGRTQAYAYFLYHLQRLPFDAKKRLRAIIEASELGSGFQIAMKDLEIRGAGDILGAKQHGAINVVGVSHFVRMLNQAVENLKEGKETHAGEAPPEVSIELPIPAFIPDEYIVSSKDKITVYQKLASADSQQYLMELKNDLIEDFGRPPKEVNNLFRILEIKLLAQKANLTNVRAENIHDEENRQIVLTMSKKVRPENIINLLEYNSKWIISGTKLKIKIKDLGLNWIDELEEGLKRLSDRAKKKLEEKTKGEGGDLLEKEKKLEEGNESKSALDPLKKMPGELPAGENIPVLPPPRSSEVDNQAGFC